MMTIDEATLLRAAGLSAIIAIIALVVSGITIALFFGGAGALWGPINDLATSVALVALVLPVVAVDRIAGPETGVWLRIVSVAAIVGIALAATGQVLLVLGVIGLQSSFVTGGIGILPVFAWLIAVAVLALGPGVLPVQVGWLAVGVLALSAGLALLASVAMGPAVWVTSVALLVVLAGWLGSLGVTFLDRSSAVA
jgi:hypothetical protein